ncbi:unnamed protein product, partial [Polarella glacialis]
MQTDTEPLPQQQSRDASIKSTICEPLSSLKYNSSRANNSYIASMNTTKFKMWSTTDAGASIASAEESLEALEARVLAKLRQRPGIWEQVPASALSPAHARPAVASSARCEQSLATPGSLLQEAEALNQSISFEDYPGEDWAAVGRPFSFGDLAGSGEQETPLGASALENSPPPLWSRPPAWTVLPKRRIEEMLKAVTTQITLRWRSAQSYE